ncbi:Phenylalanyl-tRNA synthetase alpha chain [Clostridiaceae bacterium JG1575]|nr:Phenylalanyl-tRNA synthetase alpha chain [Clostridiaceae bacterium JG1575]
MLKQLEQLKEEALARIQSAKTLEELNGARTSVLGKKGPLTEILKGMGKLSPTERKETGRVANEVKEHLLAALTAREEDLIAQGSVLDYSLDPTRPGARRRLGGLHPITQMCYDLNDAFQSMGFEIYEEPEITSEAFAFDRLNFPAAHPARESMDTYWLSGPPEASAEEKLCLRPHLTGGSVRYLLEHGAPARFVYPGRVYRNENTDARHERAFFQYEALIVDRDFSFAQGQLLIKTVLETVFGIEVDIRMRAGFFPFVEPGFEIDMKCLVCQGKGCKVCKNVGWIEVMPGGTPHPNVLKSAGLDPALWSGFYINIGLDRLVMMRYGVDDVRLFHSTDLRFLSQFK